MKILHITDAAAGGVLSSVTTLARAQAADPRFERVALRYTPRTDSPSHEEIATAMGPGVDVDHWSDEPSRAGLGLVRGLLRELRRDWDVIHLHSSRAGFLGRVLALGVRTRAHLVYSPHGFSFNQIEFSNRAARVFLGLERLALRGGEDLVLVSPGEAQVAAERLPGARTAVLANAVDSVSFAPTPADSSAADGPIEVVHLGRIMTQKRPELFAGIAEQALAEHPGVFAFTWIGDGDRSLLSACPEIEITGWQNAEGIRARLSRASLLLFTSAGEGMPISLLEAASMGVPAIGCDVIGVRDLIDHDTDGKLFDTPAEAVAALVELAEHERRRRFAAAARARVERDHCQADLAERSLRIYCAFIAPDPRSGRGFAPAPARDAVSMGTAEPDSAAPETAAEPSVASVSPHPSGEKPTEPLSVADTGSRSA